MQKLIYKIGKTLLVATGLFTIVSIFGVVFAEEATTIADAIPMSRDLLYGMISGSSVGYGFSHKTSVAPLKSELLKVEAQLKEYQEMSKSALLEKLND